MGKLTVSIPEELHQRVRDDVAADEALTTGLFIQRVIEEHYSKKGGSEMDGSTRTLAFQVSEELFQRIKAYLAEHRDRRGKPLSQKEFVVGLIEQTLTEWENEQATSLSADETEALATQE